MVTGLYEKYYTLVTVDAMRIMHTTTLVMRARHPSCMHAIFALHLPCDFSLPSFAWYPLRLDYYCVSSTDYLFLRPSITSAACVLLQLPVISLCCVALFCLSFITLCLCSSVCSVWRHHPNFAGIIEDIADKRKVGTSALLRLRPDSWRLLDIFWPIGSQKDMQQAEVRE